MLKRIIAFLICMAVFAGVFPEFIPEAEAATPYYIRVDIVNQITTVYRTKDDSVVRQMICSTGTGNNTPRGTFYLTTRASTDRKPWYWLSKYKCYVKYATRISGPILFHSLPYNSRDLDDIDRTALKKMGSKASHGCVRLYWEDAKWIAENCGNGTKVIIKDTGAKKTTLKRLLKNEGYAKESGLTYTQFKASDYKTRIEGAYGRGATGDAVTALQNRLGGLGLLSTKVSGTYDNATIAAVIRYQAATGKEQTGIVTSELYDEIMNHDSILGDYTTLREDMSGPVVRQLQSVLKQIKLYDGPEDGVYSAETAQAVNIFCHLTGISATTDATPAIREKAAAFLANLNNTFGEGKFGIILNVKVTDHAKTRKDNAKLHQKSSSKSTLLKYMSKGKKVTLYSRGSKWSHIKYSGKKGYTLNSNLTFYQTTKYSAAWGIPVEDVGTQTLNTLCIGNAAAALKARMQDLGFYSGDITPYYGSGIESAVKAYQTKAGYEPTGEATVDLQNEIFGASALTGTAVTLKEGMTSPAVSAMQQALTDLGYHTGTVDGTFDEATTASVKLFTKVNGMKETGTASTAVQDAIFAQRAEGDALYGADNYTVGYYSSKVKMVSTTQAASLYKKAGYSSTRIASIKKGKTGTLVKKGGYFSKVKFGSKTGYMRTKYLKIYNKTVWHVEFIQNTIPENPELIYGTVSDVVMQDTSVQAEDFTGVEIEAYDDVEDEVEYIALDEAG